MASLFGVSILHNKITNSTLFITDENKVIQKIYKDVCEKDLIELLERDSIPDAN